MAEALIFITSEQRDDLKKAYLLIDKVKKDISIDHEEYSIIKTTLGNLKRAIEYQEKYY